MFEIVPEVEVLFNELGATNDVNNSEVFTGVNPHIFSIAIHWNNIRSTSIRHKMNLLHTISFIVNKLLVLIILRFQNGTTPGYESNRLVFEKF